MKIMFICTGNICRSAMAEGLMKKKLQEKGIIAQVCSSGLYAETGDGATYNAIEAMKMYNVDISNHKATNTRYSNIQEMDVILCATQAHKQNIILLYPNLKNKVYTIKEFAKLDNNGQDMDIKDPWGCDMNVYENCAKEINICIEKIVELIK